MKRILLVVVMLAASISIYAQNEQSAVISSSESGATSKVDSQKPVISDSEKPKDTSVNKTFPRQTGSYVYPNSKERFKRYIDHMVGPSALVGIAFGSAYDQIRNEPEEWNRNFEGFARRVGDNFGRNVIRHTVIYGLDETLKQDSTFYRSTKRDFKSKVSNSIVSVFTSRTKSGKRVVSVPQIAGAYSSAIIANEVWMPERFDYKDGFRDGSISFLTRIGVNLLREFVFK